MSIPKRFVAAGALAILACVASATRFEPQATEPTTQEPATATAPASEAARVAMADFDAVWEIVSETYYDPEFGGLDWDAVYHELLPRVEACSSASERRAIINEMVSRLGQSHFGLLAGGTLTPPMADPDDARFDDGSDAERSPDAWADSQAWGEGPDGEFSGGHGDPGIEVRLVDGRFYVTRVFEGSPAEAVGVRMGWQLARVSDLSVEAYAANLVEDVGAHKAGLYGAMLVHGLLAGEPASRVRLGLIDTEGRVARVVVARGEPRGEVVRYANLPPMVMETEWRWLSPEEHGAGPDARIGYIRFNTWMFKARGAVDQAVLALQDADGIVLDLRGNPGGVAGMAPGIAGLFLAERASLGSIRMRTNALEFNALPVRVTMAGEAMQPYGGRLAIVQDELSASTSEIFTAGLRALGRARVFGSRSAGQALPALPTELPSGDVLMHVIAEYVPPEGTEAPEGAGVVPDVEAGPTPDALEAGRDEALRAAAAWIAGDEPAGES